MDKSQKIVLFDGDCAFCDSFIVHLLKKDRNDVLRFASLNSSFAKEKLKGIHDIPDSIILVTDDKLYFRSEAVLMIMKETSKFPIAIRMCGVVPKIIRDKIYDLFSKYRYDLFGKKNVCTLPTKEERAKFLE